MTEFKSRKLTEWVTQTNALLERGEVPALPDAESLAALHKRLPRARVELTFYWGEGAIDSIRIPLVTWLSILQGAEYRQSLRTYCEGQMTLDWIFNWSGVPICIHNRDGGDLYEGDLDEIEVLGPQSCGVDLACLLQRIAEQASPRGKWIDPEIDDAGQETEQSPAEPVAEEGGEEGAEDRAGEFVFSLQKPDALPAPHDDPKAEDAEICLRNSDDAPPSELAIRIRAILREKVPELPSTRHQGLLAFGTRQYFFACARREYLERFGKEVPAWTSGMEPWRGRRIVETALELGCELPESFHK